MKMNKNTANAVTMVRIALIPVFMLAMYFKMEWLALGLFVLASASDFVDGYIARKFDQVSNFGKIIDPLADKLLIVSALLMLIEWGVMPAWAAMIIITREFAVTSLRVVAVSEGRVIAAGLSGKIKTVTQIVCVGLLLTPSSELLLAGGIKLGFIAVLVMTVVTVWSGIEYFINNRDIMGMGKAR